MPVFGEWGREEDQRSFRDWGNFSNYPVLKWWRAIGSIFLFLSFFLFDLRMPLDARIRGVFEGVHRRFEG